MSQGGDIPRVVGDIPPWQHACSPPGNEPKLNLKQSGSKMKLLGSLLLGFAAEIIYFLLSYGSADASPLIIALRMG